MVTPEELFSRPIWRPRQDGLERTRPEPSAVAQRAATDRNKSLTIFDCKALAHEAIWSLIGSDIRPERQECAIAYNCSA